MTGRTPDYTPTPDQIADATGRIRSTWAPHQFAARANFTIRLHQYGFVALSHEGPRPEAWTPPAVDDSTVLDQ